MDKPRALLAIRRQFDTRAGRFVWHDIVVREASHRLMERLALMRHEVRDIVDVGCGSGTSRAPLLERFPGARWIGIDLSPGMLASPPRRGRWWPFRPGPLLACADAGALPLRDASCDLVFSNLMLHWHPEPALALREMLRVLRPGGLLLLCAFGPDTMKELRQACVQSLPGARAFTCPDMHDLGDLLVSSGLQAPVMESEPLRLVYRDARSLLREARALGGNPDVDPAMGLPSGRAARTLVANLERGRAADGRIPLSFELVFAHGWKSADTHRAPGDWQAVHFGPGPA